MFVEDYGLWFRAYEINTNHQGQVMLGTAWKEPIQAVNLTIKEPRNSSIVIETADIADLTEACQGEDWGYLDILLNGEGLRFLVEQVKNISYVEVMILLGSRHITGSGARAHFADEVRKKIIDMFGEPSMNGASPSQEEMLRDLYYERFGIELP